MADASVNSLAFKPTLNGWGEQNAAAAALQNRQSPPDHQAQAADFHKRQEGNVQRVHAEHAAAASDFNRQQKNKQAQFQSQAGIEPTFGQKWSHNVGAAKQSLKELSHSVKDRYYEKSAPARAEIIGGKYRELRLQAKGLKQAGGMMNANVTEQGISAGTSKLLQQAWLNIIDSWGLTLIWINVHVFCRFIFGERFFCKLGHEWLGTGGKGGQLIAGKGDKMVGNTMHYADGSKATMGNSSSGGGGIANSILGMPIAGVGLLEAGLLFLLDVIVLILLAISFTPFFLLIYAIVDPAGLIGTSLEIFVTLAKTTVGL